jgi:hypothetical protein
MLVNQAEEHFLSVRILTITVAVCSMLFFIVLIWILLHRATINKTQKKEDWLRAEYQRLLLDYLDREGDTTDTAFIKLSEIAKDEFNRNRLINELIDLSINMVGHQRVALRSLYIQLGLDEDSKRKIVSRKWHIKIKGFKELTFMHIKEDRVLECLHKALKSRNKFLRMEAQLALIRLNKNAPFNFLDHLEYPFTLWEQVNVHELIELHHLPVPQFARWTTSPNHTVVLFALRMIRIFKQRDAIPAITACLQHPMEDVRHMAIIACGELDLREMLPTLKTMYKNETSYKNVLAIVNVMGKIPDESMINFLQLVLDKEDDIQLQIAAAIAINMTGEAGVATLVKLMASEYKNYQIIIRHVLDKRIA